MRGLGPDVVLWQEVNDGPDKAAVRDGMPGYEHTHLDLSVPLSLRLPVLARDRHRTHGGMHHASPSRWVTWAVVDAGRPIPCVDTHLVSGAWNEKDKPHKEWRQDAWLEHEDEMAGILADLYRKYGVVVFGGDFNRRHVGKLHSEAVWLDARGIDKLGVIGPHQVVKAAQRVKTPSDHDARVVTVRL